MYQFAMSLHRAVYLMSINNRTKLINFFINNEYVRHCFVFLQK